MTAVLLRIRADLRARWRAWLSLTLIIGIAGGAVIAAAAGARRTDSAYSRFLRSSRAPDALVFESTDPSFASISPEQLAGLPEVAATATLVAYTATDPELGPVASPDGRFGTVMGRHKLLSGRAPVRPDEIMVSFLVAEARHLHVGSSLTLFLLPIAEEAGAEASPPVAVHTRVVGIEATAGAFPPQASTAFKLVGFSPAFLRDPAGPLAQS